MSSRVSGMAARQSANSAEAASESLPAACFIKSLNQLTATRYEVDSRRQLRSRTAGGHRAYE